MAERIEHAFIRQYAVGNRDLVAGIGEIIGHGRFLLSRGDFDAAGAKPKWLPLPSRPGAAPRTSFAVARGEGKDCLAKAPRCQQIARNAASKSENDPMGLLPS
jgi:hypothetical protein